MKKSSLRIALVLMAVLLLTLFASCGGSKTTDAPEGNTPSEPESSTEQPTPPRLDVGTDGSVPEIDWND